MSQVFANTIDGNPIYAARAEADEDGLNLKQYYAKIADLAAVAFSGSYNDLANTPSIPTKTSDLTNDSGFITASDIPAIPTKTSDLTNDSGFITASDIPAQEQADWNESDSSDPAYIKNKPTIPAAQVQSDWSQSDSSAVDFIKNKPTIPTVELFEAVYGTTSFADVVAAIAAKKIVYCSVAVSGATRMGVFAYHSSNKVEFQYYRSGNGVPDSVFIYSVDSSNAWTTTERSANCVVLSYGTSTWNDFLEAYQKNSVVFCSVVPYNQAYRYAHLAFVSMSSSTSNRYAEFWFVRSVPTHNATNQGDQVFIYTLKYDNTWTTTTREMVLQAVAGNGITRTVTTAAGAGTIAWSVKPATNGGVNVDSNGVSVDVKEAPSDGKEYVRKNGAWVAKEIVLYSGARSANAALSENPTNFEYLRVTLQYDTNKPSAVVLVDPTLGTQVVTYVKGVNTWTTYLQLTLSASAITTDNSKSISFGGMNSGTPEIASVSLDSAEDIGSIVKVVGVNRIASN